MRIQLEEELELRRFDRVKLINYQPKIVPAELIKYFVSLAHSQDSPVVNYYCAYHFPAVVLTLGRKNWPVMCSLLQLLCNHGIDDIRKTMASSIYQIALIIGRKLATQDLVPVYLRFFEDQDKVKVVALKNLSSFLTVIDRPRYDIIVAALSNCLGEYYEAGWRFREEFAQQILILVKSFGELAWSTHKLNLIGITIKLLRDRVNSIRKIALETVSFLFWLTWLLFCKITNNKIFSSFDCRWLKFVKSLALTNATLFAHSYQSTLDQIRIGAIDKSLANFAING